MPTLFTAEIDGWASWGAVFQSIAAFSPLIEEILCRHALPAAPVRHCTPGTNAVFRVGGYVVKIFAPRESGLESEAEARTEYFSVARAKALGVPVPTPVAEGVLDDKYRFPYLVTEFVDGAPFEVCAAAMTPQEKTAAARRLRALTDRLNTPCADFNGIDVIRDRTRRKCWAPFPKRFQRERDAWAAAHDFGERVFVHGDLGEDNLLVTGDGLCILDFADAVLAPRSYEQALVAAELFAFDGDFLRGYFADLSAAEIAEICFEGLAIHDFGGDIVCGRLGTPERFAGLSDLRERLDEAVRNGLARSGRA